MIALIDPVATKGQSEETPHKRQKKVRPPT